MSDLREIALASIEVGDRFRVDLGDVEALAESIESSGYTQPILVSEAGDRFVLIDGGRRLAAYELLGRMLIPAIVRPQVTDDEVALLEAVTNSHRKGWTPSEAAAKAAQIEQLLAEGRLDQVGSLPTAGERRSAWVARMVGYRDRTLRDARQLVEYEATTVDGQVLCDRLVAQMDESGQVSGPHRQWRGVRQLEVLAGNDDAEISKMATGALARALDDTTVDIAAEADGLASYAEVEIKDETAGVEPGDATPDEPAAEAVSRGRGSDAESRQASEPSLPLAEAEISAATVKFDELTGPQREALVTLYKADTSLLIDDHTTVDSIGWEAHATLEPLGLVGSFRPYASSDERETQLSNEGVALMEEFAAEWWRAQRNALNLASDWVIADGWPTPHPWTRTYTMFESPNRAVVRGLVIGYGETRLSPVLADDGVAVPAWLDDLRPAPAPVSPIGGSESPAPRGGVNGSSVPEGGELVPDPSTVVEPVEGSVEGEEFGTVPATVPAADEGPEFRRSGSSSTTHLPRRKESSAPPPRGADMLRLFAALDEAATLIQDITPAEVDRALGANRDGAELGAQAVAAIDVLTDLMPGVRFVARPV